MQREIPNARTRSPFVQLARANPDSVLAKPEVYLGMIDRGEWPIAVGSERTRWEHGGHVNTSTGDVFSLQDPDVPHDQRVEALQNRARLLQRCEGDLAGSLGDNTPQYWIARSSKEFSRIGKPCRMCGRSVGDAGWCCSCYPPPKTGCVDLRAVSACWLLDALARNPGPVLAFACQRRLNRPARITDPASGKQVTVSWWVKGSRRLREMALELLLEQAKRIQFAEWRCGAFLAENANSVVGAALQSLADRCDRGGVCYIRQLSRIEEYLIKRQMSLRDLAAWDEKLRVPRSYNDDDSSDFVRPTATVPGLPR